MGWQLPHAWCAAPWGLDSGILNLPAVLIVGVLTWLLVRGIKESARVNLVMVIVKVTVILIFIGLTAWYVNPANWQPFMPFGFKGVMTAAAIVFLAYVGFDAVSTTAEEAVNPQRDMPIGIMGSLVVATVLYVVVAAIMTGVVPYRQLNVADPVALVLNVLQQAVGLDAGERRRARRDHERPARAPARPAAHPVRDVARRPAAAADVEGAPALPHAVPDDDHHRARSWRCSAALTPINVVAELCSIGTLFAFMIVSAGVLVLRRTRGRGASGRSGCRSSR